MPSTMFLIVLMTIVECKFNNIDHKNVYFGIQTRGRSRFSGKGVYVYKGVGVRLADFISFFLNIHVKKIIWSYGCAALAALIH